METSRARIFLTHLVPKLQKIQKNAARWPSVSKRSRAIRMAADLCLAKTANEASRSAWSRALNIRSHRKIAKLICKNQYYLGMRRLRLRLRLLGLKNRNRNNSRKCSNNSSGDGVERRVRALRMLIPGGKEMADMDVLLHETADYITNLQMQVQAMQALADVRHTGGFADRCIEGKFHDNNKCSFQQVVSGA